MKLKTYAVALVPQTTCPLQAGSASSSTLDPRVTPGHNRPYVDMCGRNTCKTSLYLRDADLRINLIKLMASRSF